MIRPPRTGFERSGIGRALKVSSDLVQGDAEGDAHDARCETEDCVREHLVGADQLVARHDECGHVADQASRDDRGDHGRDDDRAELGDAELAQDDLEGERALPRSVR